jgi:hypothetical protein
MTPNDIQNKNWAGGVILRSAQNICQKTLNGIFRRRIYVCTGPAKTIIKPLSCEDGGILWHFNSLRSLSYEVSSGAEER